MFSLDGFLKGFQNLLSLDQTAYDEHWIFEAVSRLGVPEVTCLAYDECQGYAALGCKNGTAILVGNGWEKQLDCCPEIIENSPIVQLLFRLGDSLLYGVNQVGQIMAWSLTDFKCISISFPDPILKIDLNSSSPWLVISFKSGLVKLMDCQSTRMSKYLIPIDISQGQKLVGMKMNPIKLNLILLGFETDCVLWNFEEKRVVERFTLVNAAGSKGSLDAIGSNTDTSNPVSLTDVCWDPNGVEFATSYNNGQIVIWSTKKTMLQGLGLKKKKHIHIYDTGSPVENMQWVEATSESSLLFVSHSHPKMTRLEIVKERYEKATGIILNCKDVVTSFAVVKVHHTCTLLTISQSGVFEVHHSRGSMPTSETEIPTCLLMNGPYQTCTVCDDGFLLINSIKQTKEKKPAMLTGGSLYPRNTVRNYHILVTLRYNSLEFWHMSIPYPSFLCSVAVNNIEELGVLPDLSDLSLFLDVKERVLLLQTPTKLVICEFIQNNVDIDDMMDQLDNTMAALENDRSAIRMISKKVSSNTKENLLPLENDHELVSNQEEQVSSSIDQEQVTTVELGPGTKEVSPPEMNEAAVWAKDSPSISRNTSPKPPDQPIAEMNGAFRKESFLPPQVIPRTTSLHEISSNDVKCSKTPPLFIADAQWTTSVLIDIPSPQVIASYAYSPHSKCVLIATRDKINLVGLTECRVLYQKDIEEFLKVSRQTLKTSPFITHVHFCMINEHRSFIILTTQSLILFQLSTGKSQSLSAIPLFVCHCEQEFGVVLYTNGLNSDFKLCTQEYESWSWIIVITTSSVLVFQVATALGDGDASLELINRRDFQSAILNGGIVHIQDSSYVVLVIEDSILVLGMSSLNLVFKHSLMDIPVSKSHLSQAYISPAGFVGLRLKHNQWHLFQINTNVSVASFDIKVYDVTKAKRYGEEHGISIGKRNESADQLFSPVQPANHSYKQDQNRSEATGLASDLARVGDALAERGEKLDELADRSGELANASSSFANSMKQIRQAQEKRWF